MKKLRGRRAREDKMFAALLAQLLRARAEDPPMSDEEIRRVRVEGRP
jgi:hypothetical protein